MVQSTFGKPPHRRPPYKGVATESLYVPMSDGARIAIDVLRPRNAPADLKLPAILIIARYWRGFALRGFAPPGRAPIGPRQALPDFLVPHGYAVVVVDSRGSGASSGSTPHLKGEGDRALAGRTLFYYTIGEEAWKVTDVWPPAGAATHRWYLGPSSSLSDSAPSAEDGADPYAVDFEATTGLTNRWRTQDGVTRVVYPDRAAADRRLLTYTSAALADDIEITGHPVVTLYVTSTATDGAFYVYLEDVDANGRVIYLTEGQLRARHRRVSDGPPPLPLFVPHHSFLREDAMPLVPGEVAELRFGLLPISALVRKGHRLRVAIAGHDRDTFAQIPGDGAPSVTVLRTRAHASHIDLLLVPRSTQPPDPGAR
jgi:predicted acyl esterase